ncbi:hypothetical protein F5Y08DRAFT_271066 [Xylaria arbuscula]|nr:hypothetical protein F5Y08DRAFT_271066 [Xylaria arbuscula]
MAAATDIQTMDNPTHVEEEEDESMDDSKTDHSASRVEQPTDEEEDDDRTPNEPPKSPTDETTSPNGNVVYHWMKDINTRIAALEQINKEDETDDEAADDKKKEDAFYDVFHTVPGVQECSWERFKNKFSDKDCNFSIDTFVPAQDDQGELLAEHFARLAPDDRPAWMKKPRSFRQIMKTNQGEWKPHIERIRINSGIILAYLRKAHDSHTWSSLPHCFITPFKTLVQFHSKMEEELRKLEAKYGGSNDADVEGQQDESVELPAKNENSVSSQGAHIDTHAEDEDTGPPVTENPIDPSASSRPSTERQESYLEDDKITALMDSEQAYKDMKVYVDFVNEKIMPTYTKFEQADYRSNMKVQYNELWSLFRLGELVYQRVSPKDEFSISKGDGPQAASTSHRIWRLWDIAEEALKWRVPLIRTVNESDSLIHDDAAHNEGSACLSAYSLDFDGEKYSAVDKEFTIPRYEGEKEIQKLPIFPLRFLKDGDAILEKLTQRGKCFQEILSKGKISMAYDGWTWIHDPTGDAMQDSRGNDMTTPEHVNSDVIIDFRECFFTFPHWEPKFSTFSKSTLETETVKDEFPIIQWEDRNRSKQVRRWREAVVSKECIDDMRWNEYADTDRFLYERPDDPGAYLGAGAILSDEDLALLPSRLFAYALRDRKFIAIDMANLKAIPPLLNPFDDLKILDRHKKMILAIVHEHFEKKRARQAAKTQGVETHDQDFIRGKGRGIVVLLHGAPGVGKTATAEAVAHAQNKPLFIITCGDLGTTPEAVESRLQETFRLANLWNCILLMDEAEIFLSQRQKNDDSISRNAMVSVFLRTLEYYPGILFLTTNRPGALDEAVKSRVHLSLHYPALGFDETLAIFRLNINRLKLIEDQRAQLKGETAMVIREDEIIGFASKLFHDPTSISWNGRQIRNAFQIAASLAHYQRHIDGNQQNCYIGREHFEDVAKASNEYDEYRRDMFGGKDDDEIALTREERGHRMPNTPSQEASGYTQHSNYRTPASHGRWSTPPRR